METKLKEKRDSEYDGCYHLIIPCDEKESFLYEIEDYLYQLFYKALDNENLSDNKVANRKKAVVNSLKKSKTFDWKKTETFRILSEIRQILKENNSPNIDKLCSMGFVKKEQSGDHVKCSFYNMPYSVIFPLSPSDCRTSDNMFSHIKKSFFLV